MIRPGFAPQRLFIVVCHSGRICSRVNPSTAFMPLKQLKIRLDHGGLCEDSPHRIVAYKRPLMISKVRKLGTMEVDDYWRILEAVAQGCKLSREVSDAVELPVHEVVFRMQVLRRRRYVKVIARDRKAYLHEITIFGRKALDRKKRQDIQSALDTRLTDR